MTVRVFVLGPAFAVFRVTGAIYLVVFFGSGRRGSGRSRLGAVVEGAAVEVVGGLVVVLLLPEPVPEPVPV